MNAGPIDDTEDTLQDLAGYMILLMIAKDNESNDIQKRLREDNASSHNATNSAGSNQEWSVEYYSD